MAEKEYAKQFMGILPNLFTSETFFLRAFGGKLQVKDGVKETDTFMELKVSDAADVTLQEYSTDPNVAFGTGTSNSSRFGPRKEIKSIDKQVGYEAPLAIHEGIDDFTVNDMPEQVVAERLEKHGLAWAHHVDNLLGAVLSTEASKTFTNELTEKGVTKVFADARKMFVNNKVSRRITWVAYVNAEVYDFLVDNKLTTTSKGSTANVETQEIRMFKGFVLVELPEDKFKKGEQVIFAADGVGVVGLGIQTARTFDSENFKGIALQGAAKYGKYLPEENKKAIAKAKLTEPVTPPAGE
ncbi:capsid protein [uncultured Vagococcus sp.]|uniref:capsid protein n=1 Tax=uncultured Vagococcus sp. TaxID=189676 RepID=UPI0025854283|nr:capsid protein [uncultured Vagococcus sp.]